MAENVSLVKGEEKTFFKNVKDIKKLIKQGQLKVKDSKVNDDKTIPQGKKSTRGVVYLGHLPPGFTEKEMRSYFRQFGSVTKIRLSRSKKTGRSKGYGYVEFVNTDVAKIVAETMNNYLMKNRLLKAEYIPPEKQHKGFFAGKNFTEKNPPLLKSRKKEFNRQNRNLSSDELASTSEKLQYKLKKIQKKLTEVAGVNFEVNVENGVIVPSPSKFKNPSKKSSNKNNGYKQKDESDLSLEDADSSIGYESSDDEETVDNDDSIEEEQNFVKISSKNKLKKNKAKQANVLNGDSPSKSAKNKKSKIVPQTPVSPSSSPNQKNKNKKTKSKNQDSLKDKLLKKKSGGIEKAKKKATVPLVSKDKKSKMGAAEIMKQQEVPKLKKDQKIKSKKNKKQK